MVKCNVKHISIFNQSNALSAHFSRNVSVFVFIIFLFFSFLVFSHLPLLQSSSLYSIALLLFSFPSACLSPFKLFPMCPRTITKPACLFMFHWGITLFLCYYFFCVVASVWLAPDSATLSHPHYIFTLRFPRTQNAHTFPHTPNALCVSFVYASLGSMEIHLCGGFFCFFVRVYREM